MDRVNCDAHSCSHNKDNVCYANRVNIGGSGAQVDGETCCGSFLNRLLYSDLTNNTNGYFSIYYSFSLVKLAIPPIP